MSTMSRVQYAEYAIRTTCIAEDVTHMSYLPRKRQNSGNVLWDHWLGRVVGVPRGQDGVNQSE